MPRPDLGTPAPPTRIRPAASPVDTFVQPVQPANFLGATDIGDNSATQLAQALASFSVKFNRLEDTRAKRINKADLEKGRNAALTSALSAKDAIEKGLITPTQSAWFMQGFNEQRGRVIGTEAKNQLFQSYAQWAGKSDDNPAAFTEFVAEWRQRVLEEAGGSAARLSGMTPVLREAEAQLSAKHLAFTSKRIQDEVELNTSVEFGQAIDDALDADTPDFAALTAALSVQHVRQRLLGVSGTKLNDLLVETVIGKALQHESAELLDLLDVDRPDGTPGPGKVGKYRLKIEAAKTKLISREAQRDNQWWTNNKRAQEVASDLAYRTFVQEIIADPQSDFDLSRPDVVTATRFNANLQKDVLEFQSAMRSNIAHETAEDVALLWAQVYDPFNPMTQQQLVALATTRRWKPKTIQLVSSAIDRELNSSVTDLDAFKLVVGDTVAAVRGNPDEFDGGEVFNAGKARIFLIRQFTTFMTANPAAAFDEQYEFLIATQLRIVTALNPAALPENQ